MPEPKWFQQIAEKDSDKAKIAVSVARSTPRLEKVLLGLEAKPARVKYGCAKVLRHIAETAPKVLYPYIDVFVDLLNSEQNVLKWEGLFVLSELALVDDDEVIDGILTKYLRPIKGTVLISAANAITGAGKIGAAKPHLIPKITRALVSVEKANYQTPECRHIALGHVISALDRFFDRVEKPLPLLKLVHRQLESPRAGTQKKAEKFLRKWWAKKKN